jgi:hypothetical protein
METEPQQVKAKRRITPQVVSPSQPASQHSSSFFSTPNDVANVSSSLLSANDEEMPSNLSKKRSRPTSDLYVQVCIFGSSSL